ncbi:hypothetical protein [Nocardioides litoris]|uniref:hypothetical protein n=1 Tax=Nocardioides litoris TaxID=1926648 RepID=UPI00111F3917|nr:hypothetical protein [Nocardioides litoris]
MLPRSRVPAVPPAVLVLPAVLALLALLVTGCSGGDGQSGGGPPPATATPTAAGARALVSVVQEGSEPRRVLALSPTAGAVTEADLSIAQRVTSDGRAADVPELTVPVTTTVEAATAEQVEATCAYGEPRVRAEGSPAAEVERVRQAVAGLAGTTTDVAVLADGTTDGGPDGPGTAAPDDAAAAGPARQAGVLLRRLVPVWPTSPVGPGASWTVTSVVRVDGADVDEVATYTLESLDGDDYVLGLAVQQVYRAGEVAGVEVRSGRGTAGGRLTGSLGRLLPGSASVDLATQVSYVVDGQVQQVATTVSTELGEAVTPD